jgi:hypothetical protein
MRAGSCVRPNGPTCSQLAVTNYHIGVCRIEELSVDTSSEVTGAAFQHSGVLGGSSIQRIS